MPFDTIGAFSVISLYSILPSDKSGMHHNFALVMEAGFRHASTPRRRSFQRLLHPAASDGKRSGLGYFQKPLLGNTTEHLAV